MHFEVRLPPSGISNNALVYRPEEYSFDVEPASNDAFTSASVDTLNLELNPEGRVIAIWGLCPYFRWKKAPLNPPTDVEYGDVVLVPDTPLKYGVSLALGSDWPVLVDPISGWVKVAGGFEGRRFVQVLVNAVLELDDNGSLCGIWLRPDELPELPA